MQKASFWSAALITQGYKGQVYKSSANKPWQQFELLCVRGKHCNRFHFFQYLQVGDFASYKFHHFPKTQLGTIFNFHPENETKLFQLEVDPLESEVEVYKDVTFGSTYFCPAALCWATIVLQLQPFYFGLFTRSRADTPISAPHFLSSWVTWPRFHVRGETIPWRPLLLRLLHQKVSGPGGLGFAGWFQFWANDTAIFFQFWRKIFWICFFYLLHLHTPEYNSYTIFDFRTCSCNLCLVTLYIL